MSEFIPFDSPEYMHKSSTQRYYDAVYAYADQPFNVRCAVQEYLENLPFPTDKTTETVFNYLAYEERLQFESRIVLEDLALLPVRHFDTAIDTSNCSLKEVQKWYKSIARGVVLLTRGNHNQECSMNNNLYPHDFRCDKSADCPQRRLEDLLTKDVRDAQFSDEVGSQERIRAVNVASLKIEAAVHYDIVPPKFGQTLWSSYRQQFIDFEQQQASARG